MPVTTDPSATAGGENPFSFGPFRLLAAQRLLLEGDTPVRLGSRAFDILAALVERAGEVVGKAELIARAWPQTFVEDANLKMQVSALRRALGDGQRGHRYVMTVTGRGYNFVAPVSRFVAPVSREEPSWAPRPQTITTAAAHNLPLAMTRMIGREEAVSVILSRLSSQRLVTIVGAGGIGKTTVALAVAERMIADYEHGVWLIDLAPLGDPRLVPSAVATVLGLGLRVEDPLPGLVAGLRDRRMLLLLDNCEHVIDAAASLAAAVLGGTPGVNILATSRELLGVTGERGYRLGPLSSPQPLSGPSAAEAATFPAVQLFVERVTEIVEDFALTDESAPLIAEICQRLDGLPLAIEFAAPRVEVLGLEGLATHLDGGLPLLRARRRMAMPRHRTMRAVIDWSYGLLSDDDQRFLQALGIFAGGFKVEAAAAVASDPTTDVDAMDCLADLVAKSLVVADVSGARPRFRLLDTTRAYAIEKLDESGERERRARRHAEYCRHLFGLAESEAGARPWDEWLGEYACEIDNLRTALDWAFSPGGDASIGIALTIDAFRPLLRLSLPEEVRRRARQALGALGTGGTRDPRSEMRLHAALGLTTPEPSEMKASFSKVLDLAEILGDAAHRLRAFHGLYVYEAASGQYPAALQSAQKFYDLAMTGTDPHDRLIGERMVGEARHLLGDQARARHHFEEVLTHYAASDPGRNVIRIQDVIRYGADLRVSTRMYLARVLWLQGFPNQAMRAAEMSIDEAQATGHATSLCYALALAACPIALWIGNLATAAHYTGMLLAQSRRHSMLHGVDFGARFRTIVALKGADIDTESRLLPAHDHDYIVPNLPFPFLTDLTELAEALGDAGRIAEALAVVEGIEPSKAGWLTPELLRVKGRLLLLQSTPAVPEAAEDYFRQALDVARQQDALSWELRAATSLARLLRDQGRPTEALDALQPVYDRFTEGFGTADLIAAKHLLGELGGAEQC